MNSQFILDTIKQRYFLFLAFLIIFVKNCLQQNIFIIIREQLILILYILDSFKFSLSRNNDRKESAHPVNSNEQESLREPQVNKIKIFSQLLEEITVSEENKSYLIKIRDKLNNMNI